MMRGLDYKISRPSEEDWSEVVRLAEDINLDRRAMRPGEFMVCKRDGMMLGIGRIRQHPDCKELCTLGVVEAYRGLGIGTALVRHLLEGVKEPVYVVTDVPGYFKRLGFEPNDTNLFSLNEKRRICLSELSCSDPVIMIKEPQ